MYQHEDDCKFAWYPIVVIQLLVTVILAIINSILSIRRFYDGISSTSLILITWLDDFKRIAEIQNNLKNLLQKCLGLIDNSENILERFTNSNNSFRFKLVVLRFKFKSYFHYIENIDKIIIFVRSFCDRNYNFLINLRICFYIMKVYEDFGKIFSVLDKYLNVCTTLVDITSECLSLLEKNVNASTYISRCENMDILDALQSLLIVLVYSKSVSSKLFSVLNTQEEIFVICSEYFKCKTLIFCKSRLSAIINFWKKIQYILEVLVNFLDSTKFVLNDRFVIVKALEDIFADDGLYFIQVLLETLNWFEILRILKQILEFLHPIFFLCGHTFDIISDILNINTCIFENMFICYSNYNKLLDDIKSISQKIMKRNFLHDYN